MVYHYFSRNTSVNATRDSSEMGHKCDISIYWCLSIRIRLLYLLHKFSRLFARLLRGGFLSILREKDSHKFMDQTLNNAGASDKSRAVFRAIYVQQCRRLPGS